MGSSMKRKVGLNLDMSKIDDFETKRLVKLFGTRIGLALCRSDITYGILCDWYFNDVLVKNLLKIKGIGKLSALIIYHTFESYLFRCF